MNRDYSPGGPSVLRSLWLVLAQAITIAVGVLLAWRALGPAPAGPSPAPDVVSVQEAPHPASVASIQNRVATASLEGGFRTAAAKASASVVNIYTRKTPPRRLPNWLRPDGGEDGATQGASSLGSGVIVAAQGYILTNNHVVEGADEIAVMLPGEKVAEARVVGTDPESDLAVLRVEIAGLQPITFADPASVQVGDVVLAVGDPFGVGQTVTQGIVSATGRNRLGINTAIYSRSGGSQGIGFAIPVSLARQVMEQIIATGRVSRGWLGVSARDVIHETTGAAAGAALVAVQRDGPADQAGLRAGDTVLAINGKEIPDTAALINETAAIKPGSQAQFKVLRGREATTVLVELGQRPAVRKR